MKVEGMPSANTFEMAVGNLLDLLEDLGIRSASDDLMDKLSLSPGQNYIEAYVHRQRKRMYEIK
jgi:hypothetical protein